MTRHARIDALVFAIAVAVAVVHGLDDAYVHRQPGVPAETHHGAAILTFALGVTAAVVFPALRPGLRAGLAISYGALALTNGALHVIHVLEDGPAAGDPTGLLAALAGVVLVGLGASIPVRHRAERLSSWRNRGVGAVVGLATAFLVVAPVAVAVTFTHKHREPIGAPPSTAYRDVAFRSADGLVLRGWYAPSRNGAAVVVVHGGGSDRSGAKAHAQLLARHGYGVLLYDARGRGESEGSPNAFGWGWDADVAGALAFLRTRPDVEDGRIGGLGLSTGADVLVEVAARDRTLKAVVADGATGRSFADIPAGDRVVNAYAWTMFAAAGVITRSQPGAPLKALVAQVAPTPLLLISAGRGPGEREFNRIYAGAAGAGTRLWELPQVHHTAAIRERAAEYERRVTDLFDRALGAH
jgi:dienelactone hydrolase